MRGEKELGGVMAGGGGGEGGEGGESRTRRERKQMSHGGKTQREPGQNIPEIAGL